MDFVPVHNLFKIHPLQIRLCRPSPAAIFSTAPRLTIAAGLTPAAQIAAQPSRYPPALRGLRGQHPGSFEAAHAFVRDRAQLSRSTNLPAEERYDLVVVGGGISGLAAAWFYRRAEAAGAHPHSRQSRRFRRPRQAQRVHARWPPRHRLWRQPVDRLAEFRVERRRQGTAARARRRRARASRPRSSATSIPRSGSRAACSSRAKPSAATCWSTGDPLMMSGNADTRRLVERQAARRVRRGLADLRGEQGAAARALFDGARDPLAGKTRRGEAAHPQDHELPRLSDQGLRLQRGGRQLLPGPHLGFFGLGCDAVPAADVRDQGYPGFRGLGLPAPATGRSEPYIYHFPDGNASLARLLVRALIPGVAPGNTHGRHRAGAVRLRQARRSATPMSASGSTRPASTCATPTARVLVGYMRDGKRPSRRRRATRCWPAST